MTDDSKVRRTISVIMEKTPLSPVNTKLPSQLSVATHHLRRVLHMLSVSFRAQWNLPLTSRKQCRCRTNRNMRKLRLLPRRNYLNQLFAVEVIMPCSTSSLYETCVIHRRCLARRAAPLAIVNREKLMSSDMLAVRLGSMSLKRPC